MGVVSLDAVVVVFPSGVACHEDPASSDFSTMYSTIGDPPALFGVIQVSNTKPVAGPGVTLSARGADGSVAAAAGTTTKERRFIPIAIAARRAAC